MGGGGIPRTGLLLTPISFIDPLTPVLSIFLPTPLNPYGSIFYKIRGREGWQIPDISSSSNLPNSPEDSSYQKLAAQKSGFVILVPFQLERARPWKMLLPARVPSLDRHLAQ